VQQGTVSKAMFETSQATRDSSRARVDAIRAQLADRVITAPFTGMLGLRRVSPGTLVTPGTAITTLDDIHVIKLDFAVPETAIAALAPARRCVRARRRTPSAPSTARSRSLDSRVDSATRALTVRALIPNPEGLIRPGMLLTVDGAARASGARWRCRSCPSSRSAASSSCYRVGASNVVEQVEVSSARRGGASRGDRADWPRATAWSSRAR
jgi:membrane fusion protein (multidrug efflux system)